MPTCVCLLGEVDVEALGQLDGGEEADVARVAVGGAHGLEGSPQGAGGRAGRDRGDGQGQHHPSTGADPQQVLAGQQGSDPQTRSLVLTDDGVRAYKHRGHRETRLCWDVFLTKCSNSSSKEQTVREEKDFSRAGASG